MNLKGGKHSAAGAAPAFTSFFVSCAVLCLEVSLIRVFSVILWYHFGFMIISLAMLGFALAGAAVHAVSLSRRMGSVATPLDKLSEDVRFLGMSRAAALCAAGLIVPVVIALTRVPLEPENTFYEVWHALLFGLVILLTAIPFYLLGFAGCAALQAGRERISLVYGCSFLGGAAGVVLGLCGMQYLGGGGGAALAAAAAWIAGAPLSRNRIRPGEGRALALTSLVLYVAVLAAFPGILPQGSRKHFPKLSEEQVLEREWNTFSNVVFYKNPDHHGLWAMADSYKGPLPEMLGAAIDEWAITSIVKWNGDPANLAFCEAYPPTIGLETAKPGFGALVIGAGGGLDVLGALYHGADRVTAVEINPLIVDAVKGRYSEYSGNLYHNEKVRVKTAEGRHFIERDEKLYDRIIITGVDTYAASAASAFALSENYIYTVEAFQAYLKHLEPGGMLCMTRWFYDPPRQTLRLVAAAREALRKEGVKQWEKCFFIARAKLRSLILLKKEPLLPAETEALIKACAEREADPMRMHGFAGHPVLDRFFTKEGAEEMEARYPFRVDAPTDDSPFLFEHRRWTNLFDKGRDWFLGRVGGQEMLVITALCLFVFLVTGMALTAFCSRKYKGMRVEPVPMQSRVLTACLFFLIGAGYLAAETALLPKLVLILGHPVYAMSVVLVGLLVFSGIGSLASRKIPDRPAWMAASILAACASVPVFFIVMPGLLHEVLVAAPFYARIALALLIIGPPGFLLGFPFPLAIRRFSKHDPGLVARAFLWNGAGSALACPFATALAISSGFTTTFVFAAGAYLSALVFVAAAQRFVRKKQLPVIPIE